MIIHNNVISRMSERLNCKFLRCFGAGSKRGFWLQFDDGSTSSFFFIDVNRLSDGTSLSEPYFGLNMTSHPRTLFLTNPATFVKEYEDWCEGYGKEIQIVEQHVAQAVQHIEKSADATLGQLQKSISVISGNVEALSTNLRKINGILKVPEGL